MQKKIILQIWLGTLLSLFAYHAHAQTKMGMGMGCILDENIYNKVPLAMDIMRGDYKDLPESYSMRAYAPTAQSQGAYGTCVGWAASYAARTIQMAQRNNWSNTKWITDNALSPYFIYESAKSASDIYCQEGTSIFSGLQILKDIGSARVFEYPSQCGLSITKTHEKKANPYKIKDYKRLFDLATKDKTNFVKKSIAEKRPVVIGIRCPESFTEAKGKVFWEKQKTDSEVPQNGHALTVIGYDDAMKGGAFELMNSWGTEWGEQGFIWISYKDFNQYCFEAFDMTLPEIDTKRVEGKLDFQLSAGEHMEMYFKDGIYEAQKAYYSGTMFRIYLQSSEPAYIYAIGSDLKNNDYKIFPTSEKNTPLLDFKEAKVALPSENAYIQMDNTIGTDFFCILYSTEKIDIDQLIEDLKLKEGDLKTRINRIYKDKLFNPKDTDRSQNKKISFKGSSKTKSIMPVFVAVRHL